MLTIVTTVLNLLYKGMQIGVRVALSRITVVTAFVATIGTTFTLIYQSLSDESSVVSEAVSAINSFSYDFSSWVQGNDWFQMIGYALSLGTLLDGCVTTFFWICCTLSGLLLTVLVGVFASVAPILADLVLSGLKSQMVSSVMKS